MRCILALLLTAALAAPAAAQSKVKTETIPAAKAAPSANAGKASKPDKVPEILRDLSVLPEKTRKTRERILEAARSGDINKVVTVMQSNEVMPIFSFGGEKNALEFWKTSYPDSDGIEVLSILVEILESPFVHLDKGTPQEMYVWPYFYGVPLDKLSLEQKVELFKIMTGVDYKEMQQFGAYIFYRAGISPDGVWHFFVAGD
jgi:hypothetical protein